MKKIIILRGLPGSGKTYRANQIENAVIIPGEAYRESQKVCRRLMREGKPLLVLDGRNISYYDIGPFVKLAKWYDYDWEIENINTPWAQDIEELHKRSGVEKKIIKKALLHMNSIQFSSLIQLLDMLVEVDPEEILFKAQKYLEENELGKADLCMLDYQDWVYTGGYRAIDGDEIALEILARVKRAHHSG